MTSNPSTPDTDGPKTETTLTTRIRINIPGSRPIPPVVVRKPVAAAAEPEPEPEAEPVAVQAAPEPAPAAGPEEPASNWFAPRKSPAGAPAPTPAPAPALPIRTPAAVGPAPALPTRTPAGPSPALPTRTPAPPGAGAPGAPVSGFAPGAPGAPRPAGPRTGAPAGPGFDTPAHGFAPAPVPAPAGPGYGPGGPGAGPDAPFAPRRPGGPGVGTTPGLPGYGGGEGPSTEAFPVYGGPAGPGPGGPGAPAGPTGGPALGTAPVGAPHDGESPRWPGPELDEPLPTPVPAPVPAAPARPKPASVTPTKIKKGRSRLLLVGSGLIALLGVAYGAGLLLNHSDVPKGTTVLGVDISGSRDEAVAKLQTAFGNRAASPLTLTVGGKQVELKPDKAGLSLDAQTTVRNAAGSDYNPVTVIGSLLGNERIADPVMPVDEEKLQVALQELAATAGTATEGTIKFDTGKAVAVPGKAGSTLDADASAALVTKAFRDMVATGKAAPLELPVTTKNPVVDQAELDRAMKEFAEPAMSGNAIVKAGGKSLAFGAKSLPKILSMQVVDGHLVEKYDLEALKATYGNTFDGVLIMRGTGEKTAVTPQDVAGALGTALRGKTPAERTGTINTNAS
ncbi:peptidoglycan binding domain-containing protein [Streptomyces sp. NPDC050448]|uniref:peptidoglycan binding domain-containing protein n=1 Tax=Streptomyces sp. NPDC050448 TaxID=3155404 RepID=UPI00342543E8